MKKLWLLIPIFVLILSFKSNTPLRVTNSTYDKMLSVILSDNVPEMTVSDFTLSKAKEVLVIDAREKNEYEISHLPDAIWVGFKDFDIKRMSGISKNKKILVYCSIGYRSEEIVGRLIELGYTDVANLYGGIFEYVNQDNTVYDASGPTRKVHGFSKIWSIWVNKGEKVF